MSARPAVPTDPGAYAPADVRLVVADMDGTLLDDRKRFPGGLWRMLDQLDARGVTFAPASGRQVWTLLDMFPDRPGMTVIGENGAIVMRDGAEISSSPLDLPTLREAVRVLTGRGVLRPVHGRGTFVNPPGRWTDLGSIVALRSRTSSWSEIAGQLVEIRRMIEVGSAGLAAERRSRTDVDRLGRDLEDFRAHHEAGDAERATTADLDFHDHILQAAGNPFLFTVYEPLRGLLERGRAETSASREVRERAMGHHRAILDAIAAGDPRAAERAMSAHMDQTARDAVARADAG